MPRHDRTFPSQAQQRAYEQGLADALQPDPPAPTFRELHDRYLEARAANTTPGSDATPIIQAAVTLADAAGAFLHQHRGHACQ